MRRAVIIANKWWEADPLVAVLSSATSCPAELHFVASDDQYGCRGSFVGSRATVEIWCLQELMSPSKSASSSEEKARVLGPLLRDDGISLVIAFGTAATPTKESNNGCVAIGTRVFLHDPHVPDSASHWPIPTPDMILDSTIGASFFTAICAPAKTVEQKLLPILTKPAALRIISAGFDFVALSDVNVTNPVDYEKADADVVNAYLATGAPIDRVGSLETTHGVIRACMQARAPFIFVSGITNRVGFFKSEVLVAPYQQRFVAAHNAGLAIAAITPALLALLSTE